MKKNRLFMLGLVAVFVCILSLTLVSSTFAKYTTTGGITDNKATVAKWGVNVTASSDNIFKTEYKNTSNSVTVKSSSTSNVLAPGTKGNAATIKIEGTPEVACEIKYEFSFKIENWNVDNECYFPVKINLYNSNDSTSVAQSYDIETYQAGETETKNEETINKYINKLIYLTLGGEEDSFDSAYDSTNKKCTYSVEKYFGGIYAVSFNNFFKLEWEWPFEGNEDGKQTNEKDTALGKAITLPTITFEITATVTQID